MSSLLMPIVFVPKLKKRSDERRRENTLLEPTWHATCYSFAGHCIESHHILKERAGVIVQIRKMRHREDEGLAHLGAAPTSWPWASGTATLTNTRCSWTPREGPWSYPESWLFTTHHVVINRLCGILPSWFDFIFLQFLERSLLPIKCMLSRLQ